MIDLDKNKNNYEKVLVWQYGKVGSTSLRVSRNDGGFYEKEKDNYTDFIIQTHNHNVARDVMKKHKNILIINIVRLPINRNISAFYENIDMACPNFKELSINEIIKKYEEYVIQGTIGWFASVKESDIWMKIFFEILKINIDKFKFDRDAKYTELFHNSNKILFYRFEDLGYINLKILPKYGIFVNKKINDSSKKIYANLYNKHKNLYKVSDSEKNNIIDSKIINIYYSKKEIIEHISNYR